MYSGCPRGAFHRVAAIAIMLSPLLYPAVALCFCLQPNPPRVCTEFFAADAVFTGNVSSVRYLPQGLPGHDPGWLYRLKVLNMYRGPSKSSIQVYTENNSARFRLDKDQTYLLFAYKGDNVLEIYGCGNSSKLRQAGATLNQVREVLQRQRSRAGGSISGRIEPETGESATMAGIRVQAQSGNRVYQTLTRTNGSFDLHVQPGKYTLRAETQTWKVRPYDLSFSRPDDILISGGGCADVIFHATPAATSDR